jgi:hypothetical protein
LPANRASPLVNDVPQASPFSQCSLSPSRQTYRLNALGMAIASAIFHRRLKGGHTVASQRGSMETRHPRPSIRTYCSRGPCETLKFYQSALGDYSQWTEPAGIKNTMPIPKNQWNNELSYALADYSVVLRYLGCLFPTGSVH